MATKNCHSPIDVAAQTATSRPGRSMATWKDLALEVTYMWGTWSWVVSFRTGIGEFEPLADMLVYEAETSCKLSRLSCKGIVFISDSAVVFPSYVCSCGNSTVCFPLRNKFWDVPLYLLFLCLFPAFASPAPIHLQSLKGEVSGSNSPYKLESS